MRGEGSHRHGRVGQARLTGQPRLKAEAGHADQSAEPDAWDLALADEFVAQVPTDWELAGCLADGEEGRASRGVGVRM